MEAKVKYRIAGAIIIVALIAIFAPMFLNQHRSTDDLSTMVKAQQSPPMPTMTTSSDADATKQQASMKTDDVYTNQTASADSSSTQTTQVAQDESNDTLAQPPQSASTATDTTTASATTQTPSTTAQTASTTDTTKPIKVVATRPKKIQVKNTTPTAAKNQSPRRAYVIQVGSFSNLKNAVGIVNKIKKTYPAYVNKKMGKGNKVLHQVFVGPFTGKQYTKKVQADLQAQKIKGVSGGFIRTTKYDPRSVDQGGVSQLSASSQGGASGA